MAGVNIHSPEKIESGIEQKTAQPKSTIAVALIVLMYMLFSSTMLIVNKAAVKFFPAPSLLLFIQMGMSASIVWAWGQAGYIQVDALELSKIRASIGMVALFLGSLFTNIKALQYSNVETIIVFQTMTSLAVAYGDTVMNSTVPNIKALMSLGLMVIGSSLYIVKDSSFQLGTCIWVILFFSIKVADTLHTKHIIDTVPMTPWGRSFYNNFLSLPFIFVLMMMASTESTKVVQLYRGTDATGIATFLVALSCLVGIGISVSGFVCRGVLTATSFSVASNVNKVLTVFINYFIWEHHASIEGLALLSLCLIGGALYARFRT